MPSAWAACKTSQVWCSSRPTRCGVESFVVGQHRVQRQAADVFHDDARPLRIVERGIVERDGVGVLEARHRQCFTLKSLAKRGVGGDMVVHDLHHDLPAQVELTSQVNPTHPAFAELPDRLVSPQKDAAQHGLYPLEYEDYRELPSSQV